ncbi:RagB/SusD family nutrient uptake outer membrane protein [Fulvivirga sediminis]|uniref:RagB/SusD family nutrient uptake outer membrane protein n=1 Tax=Fulvivirga sediminis TaxID=2803949 RepID=A0A937FAJ4_9BACT|nr:RagB/SusD family nutrient uptake outer membrane protein [Fulvivirga sediminis]MBL3658700.1 RagB/SusD family nutrient uptake outer membrane protein [Fulvivirga sediminis]
MKSYTNKLIPFFTAILIIVSGCSDDFLEVEPTGKSTEAFYYSSESEAYAALVAVYDIVGFVSSGYIDKLPALNSASDDHYAGGGSSGDIAAFQAWNDYSKLTPATGPQEDLWSKGFQGVYRANILLSKLPGVPMSEEKKVRFAAEAQALRAYFYFDLIRFFRSIPKFDQPINFEDVNDVEQVSRESIYSFIEEDLTAAIDKLPATVPVSTEGGRMTKGAARAILGQVYLNQKKFALAAEQFAIVNGTVPGGKSEEGGYELLENFGDLFVVGNEYNSESIFEIGHTNTSNGVWDCIACTEGNVMNILVGPRDYSVIDESAGAPDFISGYSFNPVTESLASAFVQNGNYDPRYKYSISNVDSLAEAGVVNYSKGYDNTGYFLKKFAGLKEDKSTGGGNYELNFPQNTYELRLADTYLLEAEAIVSGNLDNQSRAQLLLDAVRARVGLASIPVNIDNILHERRVELAGEGKRWFDLIRNGRAASALADFGFVAGKNEFLPIPLLELNNTKIKQDPNY